MQIRKFQNKDLPQVLGLISGTFSKFNSGEGPKESIKTYCKYYNIRNESISESFMNSICYVAVENGRILGVIRAKDDRIVNLFVDGKHHRMGIGTRLLAMAEAELRKRMVHFARLRSSLYGAKFYERNGYKKTTGVRKFKGLKVQPMRKTLF